MGAEVRKMDSEAETRTFEHGTMKVAKVGSVTVSVGRFEPGWRWSHDVKPIAGTDACMVHHKGYAISRRLHVATSDGSEVEIGPGDAYEISPGHDAWVVGDETYEAVDFSEDMAGFAKSK